MCVNDYGIKRKWLWHKIRRQMRLHAPHVGKFN
jgi:hypothetical protein